MGFEWHSVLGLLYVERLGATMRNVATLGRQRLYCSAHEIQQILQAAGKDCRESAIEEAFRQSGGFCEGLFHSLWPECKVESFDYSGFEGATVVHDMNTPLPSPYKQRYDLVIDGGTLEHIFNYPNAIKNALEMPREGGFFVTITPANNAMGHGFYQFSPELLFRLLSPANGYELCDLLVFVQRPRSPWYRVSDPAAVGCRVELRNRHRVYMLAVARRVRVCEILKSIPQQSDYSARWANRGPVRGQSNDASLKDNALRLFKRKGFSLLRPMLKKLYLLWTPFDWRHYQRVNPISLIAGAPGSSVSQAGLRSDA